jgi:type VII secretion protein EccE
VLAEVGAGRDTDWAKAPAVVAALARRIGKSLRQVGITTQILDADALTGALSTSCDLRPGVQDPTSPNPREDRSQWYSGRLVHRSFWVRGWPQLDRAALLLDWLSTMPAALISVALILVPDERGIDLRCLVRVAAPAAVLPRVTTALVRGARQARADLFPLDGVQGPAVYASAPTGGGPR